MYVLYFLHPFFRQTASETFLLESFRLETTEERLTEGQDVWDKVETDPVPALRQLRYPYDVYKRYVPTASSRDVAIGMSIRHLSRSRCIGRDTVQRCKSSRQTEALQRQATQERRGRGKDRDLLLRSREFRVSRIAQLSHDNFSQR